ncbi:oligopeptide/dipeptide ABC transporter ATP-binding protein [Rhodobium orientis]|uniref:Peptide ABC transporter ATP-binding protein n=1 Tax=Rhodobium orientis TaxID=34017 RepID=A0A327JLR4_9HYPH|nr:oligopeptide/dipeptide ABC transporter ATP-binding protein [Rhodobium orientis]MBB4305630.1 oligopeptide/dipeptide ABC transporter ATP-binding protein [Rhodobium orientis]MBK5948713.1 peptide ABC transporter ATP-binding protein [Rhodobium orientis]RAI23867.1 peptide ABC transporter ATP-binding protein [Rhodobium orientis]
MTDTPLLAVEGLIRDYALPRRRLFGERPVLRALAGVDLTVERGRSLGIVGESGCGKSTLAHLILALERPTAGTVRLHGTDLFAAPADELKALRRHLQIIFQDPYGSLDPRHKVARIVSEPLRSLEPETDRVRRRMRVAEVLQSVGLPASAAAKYPHEFSGGQRQRIAIARALVTKPDLIVADEAVSALDVSVQAQVLNLMNDLQAEFGLAYVFIGHDLNVVRCVTDDVAVMYLGRIVEEGPSPEVFSRPRHPYTRALIEAVPKPDPARRKARLAAAAKHVAAAPLPPEAGCAFRPRCPLAFERCVAEAPKLRPVSDGARIACHRDPEV